MSKRKDKEGKRKTQKFQLWLSDFRTQLVSMRTWVPSLALLSGLRIWVALSYGVGHRCGSNPALPWLCRKLAVAAPIWRLAWKLSCVTDAVLKKKKKEKKRKKRKFYYKPEELHTFYILLFSHVNWIFLFY